MPSAKADPLIRTARGGTGNATIPGDTIRQGLGGAKIKHIALQDVLNGAALESAEMPEDWVERFHAESLLQPSDGLRA